MISFHGRFGVSAAMGVDGTELAGQAAPWLMGQGREKASDVVCCPPCAVLSSVWEAVRLAVSRCVGGCWVLSAQFCSVVEGKDKVLVRSCV